MMTNAKSIVSDLQTGFAVEPLRLQEDEQAWLNAEIDKGLASPPSKRGVEEIMTALRASLVRA